MPTVQSNGADISYEVLAATRPDPVVVAARAFFAPRSTFEPLAAALSESRPVVQFDPRGVRRSGGDGPYTVERDAADLGRVLDAVGRPAVVFGAVNAARAALVLAAGGHPLLRGLVLIADHPLGPHSGLGGSTDVRDVMFHMLETSYRAGAAQLAETIYDRSPPAERARIVQEALDEIPAEAYVGRLRNWLDHDGSGLPAQVSVPVRYAGHDGDWWPWEGLVQAAAMFEDGGAVETDAVPLADAPEFASVVSAIVGEIAAAAPAKRN